MLLLRHVRLRILLFSGIDLLVMIHVHRMAHGPVSRMFYGAQSFVYK